MGHRTRTYFTFFDSLFEVVHAHIGPNIARKINQNRIDALPIVELSRQEIVRFNLRSKRHAIQTQIFTHKFIAKSQPIRIRESHVMGVVIAGSPTKLSGIGEFRQ